MAKTMAKPVEKLVPRLRIIQPTAKGWNGIERSTPSWRE